MPIFNTEFAIKCLAYLKPLIIIIMLIMLIIIIKITILTVVLLY